MADNDQEEVTGLKFDYAVDVDGIYVLTDLSMGIGKPYPDSEEKRVMMVAEFLDKKASSNLPTQRTVAFILPAWKTVKEMRTTLVDFVADIENTDLLKGLKDG